MHNYQEITSLQNSRVKQVRRLRERRIRERESRFLIDDLRDLSRALSLDYEADFVFFCPELDEDEQAEKLLQDTSAEVFAVPREVIEKVSYRQNPGAVVAVMKAQPVPSVEALVPDKALLMLVLVGLKKPGNVGALLRTADAMGFSAVVLVDSTVDLYNPNVIRSSTGACFLGNIMMATTDALLDALHQHDYRIIAAAVDGEHLLHQADFCQRSAVVLGTEDQGLDARWLDVAHQRVQIPMQGRLSDSLNVSVSGAIFMYEALRHRLTGSEKL